MPHPATRTNIVRSGTILGLVALLFAATASVAACGDDDDDAQTPEEAFCDSRDSLEESLTNLAELDVIAEGTNGLTESFDAVKADLEELKSTGSEVAADELAALQTGLDDLGTAISEFGDGELTAETATAVVAAISAVGTSATDTLTVLQDTCE